MALTPGTRIGPYEIVGVLGAGGMGEVYRATDTNLKRAVAIKVLPESVATDRERLARFQREAEVLASLNHPNIAAIHGLERTDGTTALVMEFVDGPTLADRIAHGRIPADEALPIAKQLAEALEAAHEQGIIHRDLKPANIKLRPDGTVKVLDFGLAKALEPSSVSSVSATASPTITSPAMMTGVGMLLGTAAYMSPEQARGKAVDKRSDIWAFGCVLYEALTGRRAFGPDDVTETLAFVLTKDVEWAALPSSTPAAVMNLLRRCLQKDAHRRLHDIADVRIEIDDMLSGHRDAPSVDRADPFRWLKPLTLLAVAGTSAIVGGVLVPLWLQPSAVPPRVSRLEIAPTGPQALSLSGFENDFAITPDGSRIVYVGNNGTALFVRPLDAVEPTLLAKGEIRGPFISPSGEWVGYFDRSQRISKVALTGGAPVVLFPAQFRGATWVSDDEIIYASLNPEVGLQRISTNGGTATPLTRVDRAKGEQNHWWPEMLPDGRGVLFTILRQTGGIDAAEIAALDLRTNTTKVLVRGGTHARYTSNGYLVYAAGGSLRALRFDLESLATLGTSRPVVPQVVSTPFGAIEASLSRDGTLAYISGGFAAGAARALVWVDRRGGKTRLALPERMYTYPRLSPDGTRIAVVSPEQDYDVWLWDLQRATFTRATFDPAQDSVPAWTPDGRRIMFASTRSGAQTLFGQPADGTGGAEQLSEGSNNRNPSSFSPDGRRMVFSSVELETGLDVMMLWLDGTQRIEPLVRTPANERNAEISPDGRWLAYQSDESGQYEIYVRPFPSTDTGRWQITTTGGTRPLWAHTGRELFYLSPNDGSLMRLTVEPGTTWRSSAPETLLDRPTPYHGLWSGRTYDISLDDQHFLMPDYGTTANSNPGPPRLIVVMNWFEELKRLVPVN